MRKLYLTFFVAIWGAVFACESVMAQSVEGRWRNIGNAGNGAQYVATVLFYPNGTFQYEMAVGGGPAGSAGATRCSGRYQFNGQMLVTQGGCQNGMPLQFGGPVQFMNQNVIDISGDQFHRF